MQVFEHHDKLIATETRYRVALANAGHQPAADTFEQQVADVMAQRVVEVFEVVKIDEQQGPVFLAAPAGDHRLGQPVQQQAAIRQAGQGVVKRQALGFVFVALLLGDVGADTAVAAELAFDVKNRHAADGDPAKCAVFGLPLKLEVAKGLVGFKHPIVLSPFFI